MIVAVCPAIVTTVDRCAPLLSGVNNSTCPSPSDAYQAESKSELPFQGTHEASALSLQAFSDAPAPVLTRGVPSSQGHDHVSLAGVTPEDATVIAVVKGF